MSKHSAGQNDLAAVSDRVDQVEASAAVDVGNQAPLPGRQDVILNRPSILLRTVASLIALQPLLGDALKGHWGELL